MNQFLEFLKQLNKSCNVKFDLLSKNIKFYGINKSIENVYSMKLNLGNEKAIIKLNKSDKNCASLLKYIIQKKYDELFINKLEFLKDILSGKDMSIYSCSEEYIKLFDKSVNMVLIYTDGNNLDGVNVIKSFYEMEDIICFNFNNYIVIISDFENAEEHANALRELITSNLYYKCYIAYSNEKVNLSAIKEIYDRLLEVLKLGIKYKIKPTVYSIDDMKLEKIISNINDDTKKKLLKKHKNKLDLLDNDIINTIEELINCNLNISNTAKKLYVHRNTLVYRLDKIKKETGFDITNFKEAMIFYTVFLLWKENKGDEIL